MSMQQTLEVDGVTISYSTMGTGPKWVVFVHGNSCCREVFAGQMDHLQKSDWSAIALDLPGHGQSSDATDPVSQYTIPGYARLITRFLDKLGIKNPVLVGWSLGGNIAIEMLGQGVAMGGLFLTGAPPAGPGLEDFATAFDPATFGTAAGEENPEPEHLNDFVGSVYQGMKTIPESFFEAARRTDGQARSIMGAHWISGEEGHGQRDVMAKTRLPTCVLQGVNEPWVKLDYLQEMPWGNLWQGKVRILEKSGHAPFVENPDGFNQVLDKFLADV
jgi:pimeloyl-ACP methyl ester carboxylesterase